MTTVALASPPLALERRSSFLQRQRQRESSAGDFDHDKEDPTIVQINADRLHNKLSELKAGLLPSRWMTEDDLYYMAKAPDQWPWQRVGILTPTPPETPSSSIEALSSDLFASKRRPDLLPQPVPTPSIQHTQPKHTSSSSQSRHISRRGQANTKKIASGIQKNSTARKHQMATRSRCRGNCMISSHRGHT